MKCIMVLGLFLMLFACSSDTADVIEPAAKFETFETSNLDFLKVQGEDADFCIRFTLKLGAGIAVNGEITVKMLYCCVHGACLAFPRDMVKKGDIYPSTPDNSVIVKSSVPTFKDGYYVSVKPGKYYHDKNGGLLDLVFIVTPTK